MKIRLVIFAAVFSFSVPNAFAQQPDCKSIQDPKARLACFDSSGLYEKFGSAEVLRHTD